MNRVFLVIFDNKLFYTVHKWSSNEPLFFIILVKKMKSSKKWWKWIFKNIHYLQCLVQQCFVSYICMLQNFSFSGGFWQKNNKILMLRNQKIYQNYTIKFFILLMYLYRSNTACTCSCTIFSQFYFLPNKHTQWNMIVDLYTNVKHFL